jgi:proteasome lid subunit RPN8/RPN11
MPQETRGPAPLLSPEGEAARLTLPERLFHELIIYGRSRLPNEACGVLLGTRTANPQPMGEPDRFRLEGIRCAMNAHPEAQHRFFIHPLDYQKAEDACRAKRAERWMVLGFWHTHPTSNACPSRVDLKHALGLASAFPERYLYLILSFEVATRPDLRGWRLSLKDHGFEEVICDLRHG